MADMRLSGRIAYRYLLWASLEDNIIPRRPLAVRKRRKNMTWEIQCSTPSCGSTKAKNIVDLLDHHTDQNGWFYCGKCKRHDFIEKSFDLQEPGETWEPYLRGALRLGDEKDTYQPFVFLVSYKPNGTPTDIWFSYYKDLRGSGGKLKLGYGPGGPPVLATTQLAALVQRLTGLKLM